MLSFQDCLDLADVSESEIAAVLAHEHIPPIVALELGHYLLQTAEGREKLQGLIVDDVLAAQVRHHCGDEMDRLFPGVTYDDVRTGLIW